jgi:transglutaminase-like putative cysteine protease
MASKSTLLLVILFLAPLVIGLETRLLERMNLTFVQEGSVRAVGGELKYISMNVSIPAETDYQIVVSDRPVSKLDDGNSIVSIESKDPANPFKYKITSSVAVNARRTSYLPGSYEVGYAQMRYTQPTERVESEDEGIKELARNITANSSDDFERISKLAIWVNKQLTYDLSLAGQLKDAKWILENRKGVCAEYSTLFITLARSLGIPARFISGLTYDEEKGWAGHSWAEAYIGRWVPVDPTWSPPEVGYLDASHFEISKMVDNETLDNVYVLTSQNARLDWSRPDASKGAGLTLQSFKEGEKNPDYQFEGTAGRIGFGMKTVVFASVSSDDYRVVSLNLTPCTGNILSVDEGEKEIILRPGERRIVSWVVTSNPQLSSSYIYTCPLVINSDYFTAKQVSIDAVSDAQSINFNAFVEKSELRLGENETVYVDVGVARKYEGRLYMTHDDYFSFQPITRSGRYSFSLQPKRVGLNKLYLATSLGGVRELEFIVRGPQGIGVDVNTTPFIPLGAETKIYVFLTSNETERNVRITTNVGGNRQAKQIMLTGNESVDFLFNFTDSAARNITVTVESGDFLTEVVKPVTLYKIPKVNFTILPPNVENDSIRVYLIFSGMEDARDLLVTVDDHQIPLIQNGSASVLLSPGVHVVKLNYSDVTGIKYTSTQLLELPLMSEMGNRGDEWSYIRELATILPVVLYFGLVIFLLLAVLILRKTEKKNQ